MYFHQNKNLVKRRFNIEVESPKEASHFKPLETKNHDLALVGSFENQVYYIHSRFDPKKEAERWKNHLIGAPGTTYILYGFGLGYHIESLLKDCKEDDTVVIIEPSMDIFSTSIKHRDFTHLLEDSRVILYLEPSEDEIDVIFGDHISFIDIDMVKFQHLAPYDQIFENYFKLTLKKLKNKIKEKKLDLNTLLFFAEQWQTNAVRNLSSVVDSAPFSSLIGKFSNKPIVIVSAGPSLDKNIQLLKEIKDNALIMCAGSAIRSLAKHNIQPHIVVTVDGGSINAQHFDSLDLHDFHLLYTDTCHPDIPKKHKGKKWYSYQSNKHLDNWLKNEIILCDAGYVKSGPSVANYCFDIAVQLKGNPICFIGQDLAYTDNRTHASGSLFEEKKVEMNNPSIKRLSIPGYYGNEVKTDVTYYAMLKYFENYIFLMKRSKVESPSIINATEGGARIKGTKQMPFRQFIDMYCKEVFYPEKQLEEVHLQNQFNPSAKQTLLHELENNILEVKKIKGIADRGRKIAKKLVDCYRLQKNSDVRNMISKLDKVDEEIKQLESRYLFLSIMMQIGIFKVLKGFKAKPDENEKEKGIRISEQSLSLYQSISYTANEMTPVIEEVISDLKGSESGYESINKSLSKL